MSVAESDISFPLTGSALMRDLVARTLDGGSNMQMSRSDMATDQKLRGFPVSELSPDAILTPAAVLVPLLFREESISILLTRRTDHLLHHPGQISFPGGRLEENDVDARAAALRETEEEIGLPPSKVTVIGQLDEYITRTGFRITPLVGWIEMPAEFSIDEFEVAELFELPVEFLMDKNNHQCSRYTIPGGEERFSYAMNYRNYHIWGATAGMLLNLCELLQNPPFGKGW